MWILGPDPSVCLAPPNDLIRNGVDMMGRRVDQVPHPKRRTFCGMMAQLDHGLHNVTTVGAYIHSPLAASLSLTHIIYIDIYRMLAGVLRLRRHWLTRPSRGLTMDLSMYVPQALQELGMYDDTIIVFTSDNGGNPLVGGSNYPYMGAKSTAWEGGSRAPAFIRSALHSNSLSTRSSRYCLNWRSTYIAVHCESVYRTWRRNVDSALPGHAYRRCSCSLSWVSVSYGRHRAPDRFGFIPRDFHGLMHVADWMPTLLSLAGLSGRVC